MRVEVLVSTMHQKDKDFLEKMNISTDAIVINQTDSDGYQEFSFAEKTVKIIATTERFITNPLYAFENGNRSQSPAMIERLTSNTCYAAREGHRG